MHRSLGRVVAPAVALVALTGLAACTSMGPDTSSSPTSSAAPTESARLDAADCRDEPSHGRIDRTAHGLTFRTGEMRVAVGSGMSTARDNPGGISTSTSADDDSACFGFTKWGNPDPEVPPDSLLFVFRGPGTDGAQIEFLVGELTGGVLPPIGSVRPTVGPLTKPINATVGVSVAGSYYQSGTCPLKISSMSSGRASGTFSCPTATRTDANPLAPDDDVSYDADDSTTESTPPAGRPSSSATPSPAVIGQPTTVTLTGFFVLTP
ncbi:hypothetical protein QSJ19_09105 [Gordonia sp. ABSL11-1]|uniref:hypothetical protein n=1 Tax=Gordonia sp. ABSL11-1 TaxID=3053924 RepID=UPI0025738B3E|nr:hypothetical protein [Gordonia sp. ABSL11-1]MDL9945741.1 hypothetical protein [Gordonia sp. ABSL11-1]